LRLCRDGGKKEASVVATSLGIKDERLWFVGKVNVGANLPPKPLWSVGVGLLSWLGLRWLVASAFEASFSPTSRYT